MMPLTRIFHAALRPDRLETRMEYACWASAKWEMLSCVGQIWKTDKDEILQQITAFSQAVKV
ncbi:MAG: hypothetical protein NTY70_18520 [Burkholderiales bacterium]|nr:hypothetical protein [Burkholderiales bacterium]